MKKSKKRSVAKRILSVLMAVIIAFLCLPFESSAATIRSKRVVSIVYDDSGSMAGEENYKWGYANYAMQSLTAMMNKEDSLYVTYMSSKNKSKPLSLDDKEKTVKKIRDHNSTSGTPFQAVYTAYKTLQAHQDTKPDTQYWLVIMTDGAFGVDMETLEAELCKFADSKMSNGTNPKVIFFSMCDPNKMYTPADNLRSNITVKGAVQATDIITAVSDIAEQISGRYAAPDTDITFIDDKTVQVKSKLPLRSIGVLSQSSTAKVTKGAFDSKDGMVESNIPLKYPEPKGIDVATDKSLIGNVAIINNGNENIPAGTYTITFSKNISKENVKILFEPAFELRLELEQEGNKLSDFKKVPVGSVLTAKATLYEAGTDNVIDLKLLPEGLSTTVSQLEKKKVIKSVNGDTLADAVIGDKPTSFEAVFELKGFFYLYQSISFTPVRMEITGMKAVPFYDGSKRYGNDGENVIYTHDLIKNNTGIKFYLEMDESPVTKDEAISLLSEFKDGLDTKLGNIDFRVEDDGAILVYPTKSPLSLSTVYWLRWHGIQKITGNMDSVSAEGEVQIKAGWDILLELWALWIIIRFVLMFFKRKKFNNLKITATVIDGLPKRSNPFGGCTETKTVLRRMDRGVRALLYVIPPIPGLIIPLLWPASVKIGGTDFKAVAVTSSRRSDRFKIILPGRFESTTGSISMAIELPPPPMSEEMQRGVFAPKNESGSKAGKKKNKKKKENELTVSGLSTVTVCTRKDYYVKLEIEKINKNSRRK